MNENFEKSGSFSVVLELKLLYLKKKKKTMRSSRAGLGNNYSKKIQTVSKWLMFTIQAH